MRKKIESCDQEQQKIVLPKNERRWVSYLNSGGKIVYVLTSTALRDKYILYLVQEDGKCKKLGECASPVKLEERFRVLEEISKKK